MGAKFLKPLYVVFNAQVSAESMGGGDKIVLSIVKRSLGNFPEVRFIGCQEGEGMAKKTFPELEFIRLKSVEVEAFGLIPAYIIRILTSFTVLFKNVQKNGILWSASDFLPDTLPGFIFKLFNPGSIWCGNMFLKARNPFMGEVVFSVNTVFYFFSQSITLLLYKHFADRVYVLCEEDKQFLKGVGFDPDKAFVLGGGVDIEEIDRIKPIVDKKFDAVFVGRFHEQKGIDTLIETWSRVVEKDRFKEYQLGIIGWGELKEVERLKSLITLHKVSGNVELLGFKDNKEKIEILKTSKILLFPSTFESFGVVVAEGIACGVPVAAFDLPILVKNFPKGVVFTKSFDRESYYDSVLRLLENEGERQMVVSEGRKIAPSLDWKHSAQAFISSLEGVCK